MWLTILRLSSSIVNWKRPSCSTFFHMKCAHHPASTFFFLLVFIHVESLRVRTLSSCRATPFSVTHEQVASRRGKTKLYNPQRIVFSSIQSPRNCKGTKKKGTIARNSDWTAVVSFRPPHLLENLLLLFHIYLRIVYF